MFIIAHFTYHWLEVPPIRLGKALYARWQQPAPLPVASSLNR